MWQTLRRWFSRSALDNPSFNFRDPDSWGYLFDERTSSLAGSPVSLLTAIGFPPLRQGITLLSGDVAKVPIGPHRILKDGSQVLDTQHPSYRVVAHFPNAEMVAFEFWRHMMIHSLIWTHAYAVIFRDNSGNVTDLVPLLSDRTSRLASGAYVTEINGELKFYFSSEIFHLRGMTVGVNGTDDSKMIQDARDAIGLGLATVNFASKFFRHGGRIGGVLEIPAAMKPEAKHELERKWREKYDSPDSIHKTLILKDHAKFHAFQSYSPVDSQLVESSKERVRDVARLLNIPPHKLGDDSRTAYNSLEMEERSYVNSSLSHWFKAICGECQQKLLTTEEKQRLTHTFAADVSELIQSDSETRSQVGRTEIEMGAISPNEYRRRLKLPPREGGDVYLVPLNMSPSGEDSEASREDLKQRMDAYGVGVRAGTLTPQLADEQLFREELGIPSISAEALSAWAEDGGTRRPITLTLPGNASPMTQQPEDVERQLFDRARLRERQKLVAAIRREVNRKTTDRFIKWVDDRLPAMRDSYQKAIEPEGAVWTKTSGDNWVDVVAAEFGALQAGVEECLAATSDEEMQDLIYEFTASWKEGCYETQSN